jgi:hypothetical protein
MTCAKTAIMLLTALGFACIGGPDFAQASPFTITTSATGPLSGISYDNLNVNAGNLPVSFSGNAGYVTGTSAGNYAPPVLSNGNGALFGDANGVDTSRYIAVGGGGSARFSLSGMADYLGLLWGSVDGFNTLSFYNGQTLVGTMSGSNITSSATGDRTANGTLYVDINSSLPFNSVVASSTANAFEFDNIAYRSATPIPEPSSFLILGSALAGLCLILRRQRKAGTATA